jgi:hypothetical protein
VRERRSVDGQKVEGVKRKDVRRMDLWKRFDEIGLSVDCFWVGWVDRYLRNWLIRWYSTYDLINAWCYCYILLSYYAYTLVPTCILAHYHSLALPPSSGALPDVSATSDRP